MLFMPFYEVDEGFDHSAWQRGSGSQSWDGLAPIHNNDTVYRIFLALSVRVCGRGVGV